VPNEWLNPGVYQNAATRLRIDGSELYWMKDGEVRHISVNGGTPKTLFSDSKSDDQGIDVDADSVYVHRRIGVGSADPRDQILRISKTRGSAIVLADQPPHIFKEGLHTNYSIPGSTVRVAGGRVYWAGGDVVYRCPVKGCGGAPESVLKVPDGTMQFTDLSISKNTLFAPYYGLKSGNEPPSAGYLTSQLDGTTGSRSYSEAPLQLTTDEDAVYELSPGQLLKRGFEEAGGLELARPSTAASSLAVDDRYIYWGSAARVNGSIYRCGKSGPELHCGDGSDPIATGLARPMNIVTDGAAIYFTTADDYGAGAIMKLAKPPATPQGQAPTR
jgi:hypothetical protein